MWEKIFILFLITLLIHGFAFEMVPMFRDWIRDNPGIPKEFVDQIEKDNPYYDRLNRVSGIIERIFFTAVVAFSVSSGVIAMIGWASLKMATNWNKSFSREDLREGHGKWTIEQRTKMALCSLYAGLLSLFFSLVSGLIINLSLDWVKLG